MRQQIVDQVGLMGSLLVSLAATEEGTLAVHRLVMHRRVVHRRAIAGSAAVGFTRWRVHGGDRYSRNAGCAIDKPSIRKVFGEAQPRSAGSRAAICSTMSTMLRRSLAS